MHTSVDVHTFGTDDVFGVAELVYGMGNWNKFSSERTAKKLDPGARVGQVIE